jgi:hypothetical protein
MQFAILSTNEDAGGMMAQVTESLAREFLARIERGEHINSTINEEEQLVRFWLAHRADGARVGQIPVAWHVTDGNGRGHAEIDRNIAAIQSEQLRQAGVTADVRPLYYGPAAPSQVDLQVKQTADFPIPPETEAWLRPIGSAKPCTCHLECARQPGALCRVTGKTDATPKMACLTADAAELQYWREQHAHFMGRIDYATGLSHQHRVEEARRAAGSASRVARLEAERCDHEWGKPTHLDIARAKSEQIPLPMPRCVKCGIAQYDAILGNDASKERPHG